MNNYCPLIFHGIYIERFANGRHAVSPCCLARRSIPSEEPIDFENNTHLQSIREQNKNNERPVACRACWDLEDRGGESKRMVYIDLYKNNNIPLSTDNRFYNLDYNTLPLCNAKCVICSPRYSSTWAVANGINISKNINVDNYDHINSIDFEHVRTVYFNGGEPLLTNEHLTVLKKIKNLAELEVFYNTNGSCYPSDDAIKIWNQCKSVTVAFSIDGVAERFEETRTPLKWNTVSSNIQKMNQLNIKVQCAYTIGRHNVYDLADTIRWFETLPGFDLQTQFHVHYVNPGHSLDLKKTSADDQHLFKQELSKFKDFHWYESITNFIGS